MGSIWMVASSIDPTHITVYAFSANALVRYVLRGVCFTVCLTTESTTHPLETATWRRISTEVLYSSMESTAVKQVHWHFKHIYITHKDTSHPDIMYLYKIKL